MVVVVVIVVIPVVEVRRLQADAGRETAIRVCFADILTIPKDLPPTFST